LFFARAHVADALLPPPLLQPLNTPIQQWSPAGDYFIAIAGFMPAEILKDVPPPAGGASASAGPGGLDGLLAAFRKLLGGASDPFFAVVSYKERSG